MLYTLQKNRLHVSFSYFYYFYLCIYVRLHEFMYTTCIQDWISLTFELSIQS